MADIDFPAFTAMLRAALKDQVRDGSAFLRMIAEDVTVEYPYASREPQVIRGRPAMQEHFGQVARLFAIDRAEIVTVCQSGPEARTFIEFDISGEWLSDGSRFNQRNVCVIETAGGYITRYREYWNPLLAVPPAGQGKD